MEGYKRCFSCSIASETVKEKIGQSHENICFKSSGTIDTVIDMLRNEPHCQILLNSLTFTSHCQ